MVLPSHVTPVLMLLVPFTIFLQEASSKEKYFSLESSR
jgi:hypothetical protein